MRVLFTSLPATGHFNSTLPLAMALRDTGHDVAYCCAAALREEVTASGFTHLPGGPASFVELFEGSPPASAPERARWVQAVAFATRATELMLPDLATHVRSWQPNVLVRESAEYGALVVGEQLGLPHASIATGAWAARDDRREIVAAALAAWRTRLGLPSDPEAHAVFRYLSYSFMPPAWDGQEPGMYPPTTHFIRYENPQRAGVERPAWLEEMRDPLVLASLGTVMHAEPGLLEAIIEALADEPMQVVAAIGRDQHPARFGTPPANVRLERYVPQIPLLEASNLFVTHGGFNSTKEALSLGVPLVVIPISGDQPHTAQRVEALGLGRAVWPHERTPGTIRARIREVMGDERFRRNARAFADEMRAQPPVSHAVDLLERLAASGEPILRI
jgi:MGT family glycosyltransferase